MVGFGLPQGLSSKESTCNAGNGGQETRGQFLGWEDPLEKGNGNPLQYYCLKNLNPWDLGLKRHDWATKQQQYNGF